MNNSASYKLHDKVRVGSYKLHDKVRVGSYKLHDKVRVGSYKLHDKVRVGSYKLHDKVRVGSYKLHDKVRVGSYKLHDKVRVGTGVSSVTILSFGQTACLISNFYLSVTACTVVSELSLRYTVNVTGTQTNSHTADLNWLPTSLSPAIVIPALCCACHPSHINKPIITKSHQPQS